MDRDGRAGGKITVRPELAADRHQRVEQPRVGQVDGNRNHVLDASARALHDRVDGAEYYTCLGFEVAGLRRARLVDETRLTGDPDQLAAFGDHAGREATRLGAILLEV